MKRIGIPYWSSSRQNKIILLLLLLICLPACGQISPDDRPKAITSTAGAPAASLPAVSDLSPSPAWTVTPSFTTVATPLAAAQSLTPTVSSSSSCAANPITAGMLEETSPSAWLNWVKKLSGAEAVTVGGKEIILSTRYTPAMFGASSPNALDFVHETIAGWYPKDQITIQSFTNTVNQQPISGKNLILTIPGSAKPEEVVILSAHLDSTSRETPEKTAPGAEDNASGSAALLEAARLLRGHAFERTIRIIWFTGEEQGLLGSKAYVKELKNPAEIQAVINLDMFGYDTDNDRCFEIHAGTLPASGLVGQCFLQSITEYDLGLPQPDYLTGDAVGGSDHSSFWKVKVGAIEILENMFDQRQPGGCSNADRNASYHSPQDTYDRLNPDSAIRIVRASLAALTALARPIQ